MPEAIRYDAVHLRYEDNNIRYGEGCEVEMVAGYDYDRLSEQLSTLQADRDIKAANLKLLVETALAYKDARDSAVGGPDHIDTYEADRLFDGLIALARGLKQ
jgi:hypothetical protein